MGFFGLLAESVTAESKGGEAFVVAAVVGFCGLLYYYFKLLRRQEVYLLDFACHLPGKLDRLPCSKMVEHASLCGLYNDQSVQFLRVMQQRSGVGNEGSLPRGLHFIPPRTHLSYAREELDQVFFSCLDSLFEASLVPPSAISILIVNCSLFNPTPSLCSVIINKYKLPPNIQAFNLSGMGCSAGLISVDLAHRLLRGGVSSNRNKYALVVSTENVTQQCYMGNERSMLLPLCLFRTGGAAVLLSNRRADSATAKYKLAHTVRTHKGGDPASYRCAFQMNDEDTGRPAISLSKTLITVAGEALKAHITTLAPLVLPLSEKIRFLVHLFASGSKQKRSAYRPDFKLAFQHFCLHSGGRAVIDELEKRLQLSSQHLEASRMTLYRFGNTSSASVWYELAYLEAKGVVHKGHHVWQLSFGSGFKCNSAVWVALRRTRPTNTTTNPWFHFIKDYPIAIPDILTL